MFVTLILAVLAFSEPEPMNITIGDPILDIEIQSLAGETLKLEHVLDSSFSFFLSVECLKCLEALQTIQAQFEGVYPYVLVYIDPPASLEDFAALHGLDKQIMFTVDSDQLKPYRIHTVPALLAYQKSRLKIAFHGPLTPEYGKQLVKIYETDFSRK